VLSFTEALAEELAGTGVTVTALCPGPTATNFGNVARGPKQRHFEAKEMSAEVVARHGHQAFRGGKVLAVPGPRNHAIIFLTRIMPRRFLRKMVKSFNAAKK
jgi:hypothetical protein